MMAIPISSICATNTERRTAFAVIRHRTLFSGVIDATYRLAYSLRRYYQRGDPFLALLNVARRYRRRGP